MSEDRNKSWNNILTILFILLFLVCAVIVVEKTDLVQTIKEEYSNNVPQEAQDQFGDIINPSNKRTGS